MLVDEDGQPNGRVNWVKSILADDYRNDLWEILDRYNQIRIVTRGGETRWLEVPREE